MDTSNQSNLCMRGFFDDDYPGIFLFGEGLMLVDRWLLTPNYVDGDISFVMATWAEKNESELLEIGNSPETISRFVTEMLRRSKIKDKSS